VLTQSNVIDTLAPSVLKFGLFAYSFWHLAL